MASRSPSTAPSTARRSPVSPRRRQGRSRTGCAFALSYKRAHLERGRLARGPRGVAKPAYSCENRRRTAGEKPRDAGALRPELQAVADFHQLLGQEGEAVRGDVRQLHDAVASVFADEDDEWSVRFEPWSRPALGA